MDESESNKENGESLAGEIGETQMVSTTNAQVSWELKSAGSKSESSISPLGSSFIISTTDGSHVPIAKVLVESTMIRYNPSCDAQKLFDEMSNRDVRDFLMSKWKDSEFLSLELNGMVKYYQYVVIKWFEKMRSSARLSVQIKSNPQATAWWKSHVICLVEDLILLPVPSLDGRYICSVKFISEDTRSYARVYPYKQVFMPYSDNALANENKLVSVQCFSFKFESIPRVQWLQYAELDRKKKIGQTSSNGVLCICSTLEHYFHNTNKYTVRFTSIWNDVRFHKKSLLQTCVWYVQFNKAKVTPFKCLQGFPCLEYVSTFKAFEPEIQVDSKFTGYTDPNYVYELVASTTPCPLNALKPRNISIIGASPTPQWFITPLAAAWHKRQGLYDWVPNTERYKSEDVTLKRKLYEIMSAPSDYVTNILICWTIEASVLGNVPGEKITVQKWLSILVRGCSCLTANVCHCAICQPIVLAVDITDRSVIEVHLVQLTFCRCLRENDQGSVRTACFSSTNDKPQRIQFYAAKMASRLWEEVHLHVDTGQILQKMNIDMQSPVLGYMQRDHTSLCGCTVGPEQVVVVSYSAENARGMKVILAMQRRMVWLCGSYRDPESIVHFITGGQLFASVEPKNKARTIDSDCLSIISPRILCNSLQCTTLVWSSWCFNPGGYSPSAGFALQFCVFTTILFVPNNIRYFHKDIEQIVLYDIDDIMKALWINAKEGIVGIVILMKGLGTEAKLGPSWKEVGIDYWEHSLTAEYVSAFMTFLRGASWSAVRSTLCLFEQAFLFKELFLRSPNIADSRTLGRTGKTRPYWLVTSLFTILDGSPSDWKHTVLAPKLDAMFRMQFFLPYKLIVMKGGLEANTLPSKFEVDIKVLVLFFMKIYFLSLVSLQLFLFLGTIAMGGWVVVQKNVGTLNNMDASTIYRFVFVDSIVALRKSRVGGLAARLSMISSVGVIVDTIGRDEVLLDMSVSKAYVSRSCIFCYDPDIQNLAESASMTADISWQTYILKATSYLAVGFITDILGTHALLCVTIADILVPTEDHSDSITKKVKNLVSGLLRMSMESMGKCLRGLWLWDTTASSLNLDNYRGVVNIWIPCNTYFASHE